MRKKRDSRANRRYYLHGKIRGNCRLNARGKTINVTAEEWAIVNGRGMAYMLELRDKFQYAIQLVIV